MSSIRYNHESILVVVAQKIFYTKHRAVNANWNADNGGWNVNANEVDNPNTWNADNQVVSRNYLLSPTYFGGSFVCNPRFQPPSIRPISSNLSESSAYLSV